jgi:hypothetical protein
MREREGVCCCTTQKTSLKLFPAKVTPILTYGLEQIWGNLTENDLTILENVKAEYLKSAFA